MYNINCAQNQVNYLVYHIYLKMIQIRFVI